MFTNRALKSEYGHFYLSDSTDVQECLEDESEADLHTHLANCKKNPGHTEFIPVNKFSIMHLPDRYQDKIVYKLTKTMADITVRIACNFTSPGRPEFVPGTKDPYPCYKTRGQKSLKTGTGGIRRVKHCVMDQTTNSHCPCPTCSNGSNTPRKEWWCVEVITVSHVVFDEEEARQSSCRFWFNDDESPVVTVSGLRICKSMSDLDWCSFHCVTHDKELADKIEKKVEDFYDVCLELRDKYRSLIDVDKLTIIVSHPHGCSKQVSVGHWVHRQDVGNGIARYTYTNQTCPGSSGALVYFLGNKWPIFTHSRASGSSRDTSSQRSLGRSCFETVAYM